MQAPSCDELRAQLTATRRRQAYLAEQIALFELADMSCASEVVEATQDAGLASPPSPPHGEDESTRALLTQQLAESERVEDDLAEHLAACELRHRPGPSRPTSQLAWLPALEPAQLAALATCISTASLSAAAEAAMAPWRCLAMHDGEPCRMNRVTGARYCSAHLPLDSMQNVVFCRYREASSDGQRLCLAPVARSALSGLCAAHDRG